jgi:hypothetical protein
MTICGSWVTKWPRSISLSKYYLGDRLWSTKIEWIISFCVTVGHFTWLNRSGKKEWPRGIGRHVK